MLRAERARVCQPLQAPLKKGALPETEKNNTVLSPPPVTLSPMSTEVPQEPIPVLYGMSEGPGTPRKWNNPIEPIKHPGLLLRGASSLEGTGSSPSLLSAVCGVKAGSFSLSGPQFPHLIEEEKV